MKKILSLSILGLFTVSLLGAVNSYVEAKSSYRSQMVQVALIFQDIANSNAASGEYYEAKMNLETIKKQANSLEQRLDRTANKEKRSQILSELKDLSIEKRVVARDVQLLKRKAEIAQRKPKSTGRLQISRAISRLFNGGSDTSGNTALQSGGAGGRCNDARALNVARPLPCVYPTEIIGDASSLITQAEFDAMSSLGGGAGDTQTCDTTGECPESDDTPADTPSEGEGDSEEGGDDVDVENAPKAEPVTDKNDGKIEACVHLINYGTEGAPYYGVPFHDGTITVNGNTYKYRSGGYGRGDVPQGKKIKYRITKHLNSRSGDPYTVKDKDGKVGFTFMVESMEYIGCDKVADSRYKTPRKWVRIHPDGNDCGTEGCFGLQGGSKEMAQFRDDMNAEIDANGGFVELVFDCGDEEEEEEICGCTDSQAINYDDEATFDDDTCEYRRYGCTDPNAISYDKTALEDDGSCFYLGGCTNSSATNYDPFATWNDNSCTYSSWWGTGSGSSTGSTSGSGGSGYDYDASGASGSSSGTGSGSSTGSSSGTGSGSTTGSGGTGYYESGSGYYDPYYDYSGSGYSSGYSGYNY